MAGSEFQERINKQGRDYIEDLRAVVAQLWEKCCEEDGIPPDSKFVVFSEANKYMQFYNNAMTQLMEASASYKAGGYVGLRVDDRSLKTFKKRRAR